MAYEWWFAIAEFVDNSTQSFVDNRIPLERAMQSEDGGTGFYVKITLNLVSIYIGFDCGTNERGN